MFERFQKYKGIHPGAVIDRELKKRNLSQRSFAISLPEHPQSFNAIIKGKRKLNTALALKIEHTLGLEEGALLMLQMFYDISEEKRKDASGYHPDFSILRKSLFWDTDIHSIDWDKHDKAVIRRVFERGNASEKEEIIRFYGPEKVKAVVGSFLDLPHEEDGLCMATVDDIVAMKIDVISRGGRKKDFWDLHELLNDYSLQEMLALHKKRTEFTHDEAQILKNLLDFARADEEYNPICLRGHYWEFIKEDIEEFVARG